MNAPQQQSLRITVSRIITGFAFVVVLFYTFMMLQLKDSGLRDATHSVLFHEAQLYLEQRAKDPNAPLPNSYSLKGYVGEDSLPDEITKVFPPEKRDFWHRRASGIYYTISIDDRFYWHHHLLIKPIPNSNEELFLHYRLGMDKNIDHNLWGNVRQVAYVGFALVIAMLLVLRKFIRRAFKPLGSLTNWINTLKIGEKPKNLPNDIQPDEIGQLANTLFDALLKNSEFNERERAFLRNASHELRTPIAIIRNTMDVLEHKTKNKFPELEPQLQRIRRASDSMKAVTEAILWLAMENYSTPKTQTTNLHTLVQEIVEQNKNLLQSSNIEIELNIDQLGDAEVEHALAYITLDNLVRNAYQHCQGGKICFEAKDSLSIRISNQRLKASDRHEAHVDTGGFGLGLALVQKIAQKRSWRFEFSQDDDTAVAFLSFSTDS